MKNQLFGAAVCVALLTQGVGAQTTNDTNSNASSGSVSGATAVSAPTVNVTPTSNNNTSSGANSTSGAVSGSVSTGGAGGAGGTSNVLVAPNVGSSSNANSSTRSRSDASNAGNTQNITFNTPAPPTSTTSNVNQTVSGGTTNRTITEGTSTVNQNVSGGTSSTLTTNGTTTQNQNLNASTTSTQRLEGGTTSTNTNINRQEGEATTRIEYSGTQTIRNVPSVSGPPLTTSNDTCMGSSSGSINGPGFGIGLGSTWQDKNCVMLKNARELWNMGMKAASLALICNDEANRVALEVTGFTCPQTAARQRAEAETARVAAAATEREMLRRRVAELEAPRQRPAMRVWGASAGEIETPLPAPVLEPQAAATPAVVAEPRAVLPTPAVVADPAALPEAEAHAIRQPPKPLSTATPEAESGAQVVRVVSEPAR